MPADARAEAIAGPQESLWREAPHRFFQFLKGQLTPGPGELATLARMVIAVLLTLVVVSTFRVPFSAITLFSVFTITRDNPRASLVLALESVGGVTIGVGMSLLGTILFIDEPLLSFLFYAAELFLVFFLIRTTRLTGPAVNMGLAVSSVRNIWERSYPASAHVEQTLWVWLSLSLGFTAAALVEWAFVRQDAMKQAQAEVADRLGAVAGLLSAYATGAKDLPTAREKLLSYAFLGAGRLRERINAARNAEPGRPHLSELSTITALTSRLVDISANLDVTAPPAAEDIPRLKKLAARLEAIRTALAAGRPVDPAEFELDRVPSARIPLLPELEWTAALIPRASAPEVAALDAGVPAIAEGPGNRIFLPDAFTNPGYILFATKGCLAAMLCYILYSGVAWQGISTSVVTCLVTALATVGATKQKQILRLAGATFGGLIGMASIAWILPDVDSITGVVILFAIVSAIGGWFVVTSPRLSYFGLQTCLAFYLTTIQDFETPTSLAPARDRFAGVLLGLSIMWLVFDNLWPVHAAEHMQKGLARNIRLLAKIVTALDTPDRVLAIQTIRSLRDRLQSGITAVQDHADSVLFEVGAPRHEADLALREAVLRWQATVRTLSLVQLAICQYRTQVVPGTRPAYVREAQRTFDQALAQKVETIAQQVECLSEPLPTEGLRPVLEEFERAVQPWVEGLSDQWIITRIEGIRQLSSQAAKMADSLAADVRESLPQVAAAQFRA